MVARRRWGGEEEEKSEEEYQRVEQENGVTRKRKKIKSWKERKAEDMKNEKEEEVS